MITWLYCMGGMILKNLKILNRVLREKNRKPVYKILKEVTHSYFLERDVPTYYFIELLYKDETRDYRNYISHQKLGRANARHNSNGDVEKLKNKIAFEEILKANSVPTPLVIGHNNIDKFNVKEKLFDVKNEKDLRRVIDEMIRLSKYDGIFVKPVGTHGGTHTFKITANDIDDRTIAQLFKLTPSTKFIFQDLIVQHEEVNKVYPHSINTVRVNAMFDRNKNEASILSALMRFGSGGSVVDNASQGGFFVPVNIDNWCLEGIGRSFFEYGGHLYKRHPDTQHLLDGVKIPHGEKIPSIISEATLLFDKEIVGWDVAITPEGPVIVEGNHNLHLGMAQMACGGFKDKDDYKKVLDL